MVLNREMTEILVGENRNVHDFVVVDVKNVRSYNQIEKIKCVNEIIMNMSLISMGNDMARRLGLMNGIDFSVLSEAIQSVFSCKSFDQKQLERYYATKKEIYNFMSNIQMLHDTSDYYIPVGVELFLLGMDIETALWLSTDSSICESYEELCFKLENSNIDIEAFINESMSLIKEYKSNLKQGK